MEENLSRLKKGDLRIPVHRMELSRIRFMINSYLRLRLSKIQESTWLSISPLLHCVTSPVPGTLRRWFLGCLGQT